MIGLIEQQRHWLLASGMLSVVLGGWVAADDTLLAREADAAEDSAPSIGARMEVCW